MIGLISTGSEVVEADQPQTPGKIRNANRSTLTALLSREGCRVRYLGLAGDEAESIAALISEGLNTCDAVILTGGVSVGDWDVTPEAMERAGADILLRGVDMKPGMACAYGAANGKLILGLSGNPASSLTNFCACALPALRRLCGSVVLQVFLDFVRGFLVDDSLLHKHLQVKRCCGSLLSGCLLSAVPAGPAALAAVLLSGIVPVCPVLTVFRVLAFFSILSVRVLTVFRVLVLRSGHRVHRRGLAVSSGVCPCCPFWF